MLWLLFILPVVSSTVFPYPLKDFRTDCQRSDGNGVCDLQCRNFFPGAEETDCREKDLVTHNTTLLFEVHDISFKAIVFKEKNRSYYCQEWRRGLEWRLRKYMEVEVELLLSDKELFDMGVQCFESGGICLVDLPFSLTLTACSTCPTLHDALGKLSQHQENLSEMALRYVPTEKTSTLTEIIFIVIGTVGLLAFAAVNVLVTTSRRRKIHSHTIWMPPMEKKQDRFPFHPQLPVYCPAAYEQFLDSSRTSLNNSLNDSYSLVKSVYVVDSRVTDLHLLSTMNLSEQEMISRADQLIHEWGVDINAVTESGETAVNRAVRQGKCELADHLLRRGADGNIPDSSGYSLLHHAVSLRDVPMLKMLLTHRKLTTEGCDEKGVKPIDEQSYSGKTALMECAFIYKECGVEMARMLIAAGADISLQGEKDYRLNNADYSGKTVLHYAAQTGNTALIQLLVDSFHEKLLLLNLLDYHNKTPMYYACEQRHCKAVELLMELGANQYLPPMEPSSFPIEAAKERGFDDIIDLLETYKNKAREVTSKPNKYAVRKSKQRRATEQAQLLSPSSSTSSSPSTTCSQSPATDSNSPIVPPAVFDYRTHQNPPHYHPYAYFDNSCRYNAKMRLSPPYFSPPTTDESITP